MTPFAVLYILYMHTCQCSLQALFLEPVTLLVLTAAHRSKCTPCCEYCHDAPFACMPNVLKKGQRQAAPEPSSKEGNAYVAQATIPDMEGGL